MELKNTAEEAQKSVKGMEENAIHAKYIELVLQLLHDADTRSRTYSSQSSND